MRRTTSSSVVSALSRGTGSSKPAASGYSWSRGFARNDPLFSNEEPGRRVSSSESRSASRSIAGIDWCRHGPRRERCYVPCSRPCSRGAKPQRLRRSCKIRSPDLLSQVRGLKSTNIAYAQSMVKNCLQFVAVCPICIQPQKWPQIHRVKFGSQISGWDRAVSWATVSHDLLLDQTANAL